ncbi:MULTISPECIES: hypothetical protein [Rhodococcus]|uniref:Uncharacterized protein n=1 Tax=Rhodococcus opacus RKJ300 = JCM 13270 TaxID=1165867 RepID=I0WTZ2_RHOOP|nr:MULTISPECIES: hypothetical protein [Rhodococcus]EID79858.1 hypothetical protein W59_11031 [Rhodococcus opacus RKJ300 = JCM 13270]KAF0959214.1 hypothetical protein MLGJGCBP_07648 [Rhodococcus sp. T7]QQZ18220.1 hypothetical protein GO592_38870 [Rhodococcus sp. 21391]UOT08145.1 hypothetical protein MPY17_37960 [Rhodococcus opacus]
MDSDVSGRAQPEARLAGHLLTLLGDRDIAALSAELSPLVHSTDPARRGLYGGVLSWLVTALADVVVARLGTRDDDESYLLEMHTTAGRTLGIGDLPTRDGRVQRSVLALLAGDRAAARTQLAAAEKEPEPVLRARTLVEALVWLDAVLNTDMPVFPDPPPR